jgi:site-specific recombinase XerD
MITHAAQAAACSSGDVPRLRAAKRMRNRENRRSCPEQGGIVSERKDGYLFRHTLATEMLGRGSSLREIGEVLRHRKAGTTQIYAKVDFRALRDLAQPWPGGAR